MVPDSSVIVAIHLREPGYERLIDAIDGADVVAVGIPTLLETAMVLTSRLGYDARPMIHAFLRRLDAQLVPFERRAPRRRDHRVPPLWARPSSSGVELRGLHVVCDRIFRRHAFAIYRRRFYAHGYRSSLTTRYIL